MTPGTSFFRKGAIALTTAAAVFAGTSAHAGDFTSDQCRMIAAVAGDVMKAVGASKLSIEFRTSLIDFIMPNVDGNGRKMTCDGNKRITTSTADDVAAFLTMREILLAPPSKISLEKAGLRSVDPREVAARDTGRAEVLPGPRPGG